MAHRFVGIDGGKIRRLCSHRDMSLRGLARKMGEKWGSVKDYIYEKSKAPPEMAEKFADALEVPIEDVVKDEDIALKTQGLDMLKYARLDVLYGGADILTYFRALRTIIPYFESKVFGAGSFDVAAYVLGVEQAKAAVKEGDIPDGMSAADAQLIELMTVPSDTDDKKE